MITLDQITLFADEHSHVTKLVSCENFDQSLIGFGGANTLDKTDDPMRKGMKYFA